MARKKHSKELKASTALGAIKGQKTMSELASEYGAHSLKRKAKQFGYNLVNVKEHELLTAHLQI